MNLGVELLFAGLASLVLINFAAYEAFRWDKVQAQAQGWRVPEATLLGFALFGGWFGAKLAQHKFRHKTRKMPFRRLLNLIPSFWIVLAVLVMQTPLKNLHPIEFLQEFKSQYSLSKPDWRPPRKFFKRVGD